MKNTIKLVIYFIFVSFFLVILDQSFMKPRGDALFLYIFHQPMPTIFDTVMLYLLRSLPVITVNIFMIWLLKNLFSMRFLTLLIPLYIVIFLAMETVFIYIINFKLFQINNHFWHYFISIIVYSFFMLGLTIPTFSISSDNDNEEEE